MSRGGASQGGAETVAVRRARREDVAAVERIEAESFSNAWSRDVFETLLDRAGSSVLIATVGGAAAGYAVVAVADGEAEVMSIAVARGRRRSGVGAALLDRAAEVARSAGARRVHVAVRSSNRGAVALYERMGYRGIGVHPGYYEGPPEDAIVMSLPLGE